MDPQPKLTMLNACRSMLRPVVRLLLKNGVTWKEFADLSKNVYVEVAGEDYGISGRQTNSSRVSILTGLTRREVKKQRDQLAGMPVGGPSKTSNATRLLSGWFQDPEFVDGDGTPRVLPREGQIASFEALHRRYGGDIPAVAMLKELTAADAIRERDGGLQAISRYYMPSPLDPETVVRAGSVLNDLGSTVTWNLTRDEDEPSRFEGRATEPRVPLRLVGEFRDYMEAKGQAFLEEVDRWLHQHRSEPGHETQAARLGVGVYMIANEDSSDHKDTEKEGA